MPRQALSFGSNPQRSNTLDGARLVNMYTEAPPLGSRAPSLNVGVLSSPLKSVLYGTPGQKPFTTAGIGTIRCMRYALGFLWALSGSQLYRINSMGSATLCSGASIFPAGTAVMSDNGVQLAILSSGQTFVVGLGVSTFTFNVTGGTYTAGTNQVASVTVGGVAITSAAVNWIDTNESTANAIVANINAYTSSPDYTALANGSQVIISAVASGTGPNGLAAVVAVSGNVTVNPLTGVMAGGSPSGGSTIVAVTSAGYPSTGVSSLDFMDGYTVMAQANSRQIFLSKLYDTTTISPLDYGVAQSTSDNIVRVIKISNEIVVLKTNSTEFWADSGASPFPFAPVQGAVMDRGCAAILSAAKVNNTLFWLGDDLIIYSATGYTPTRISTHGIEEILRAAPAVSDAIGLAYTMGGHAFYILTLPSAGRTLCWDTVTQGWHERQSGTSVAPAAWAPLCMTVAFGNIYVGLPNGVICQLDLDTYTDNGAAIRRVAITPPFFANGLRQIHSYFEIECDLGVGLNTGQGSAPLMMLRWSDDGGATWSNQHVASFGKTGDRVDRAQWFRLGSFRQREYEVSISDPVKVAIFGSRFTPKALAA